MTTHLLGLRIEQFKRLTLVDLTFDADGGVFAIQGANEAGKSSLLDALEVAIAGRKGPKIVEPVHKGADAARIVATFDDIVVTRTYKATGQTAIEVKAADGRRVANAEDLLRDLYSHVALDPLAFSMLSDADQVATLLPMIGFDPAPLEKERKDAFELRTIVHRDVHRVEQQLAGYDDPRPGLPAEVVSVAELSGELSEALTSNDQREQLRHGAAARRDAIERNLARIDELTTQIEQLHLLNSEHEQWALDVEAKVAAIPEIDIEPIRARIEAAETTNAQVRHEQERARLAKELADYTKHAGELTATIDGVKEKRAAALTAAKMPVPGLSIDDEQNVLTLNGVPFSQASTGVKIRTGTAIAVALNPELRVIVIRDASLLDAGNRAVIDELAKANGFLVLMEIADESMPVGVVIEAGTVRDVRP